MEELPIGKPLPSSCHSTPAVHIHSNPPHPHSTTTPFYLHNYPQCSTFFDHNPLVNDFNCCWASTEQVPHPRNPRGCFIQRANADSGKYFVNESSGRNFNVPSSVFPSNSFDGALLVACTCLQQEKQNNPAGNITGHSYLQMPATITSNNFCSTCCTEQVVTNQHLSSSCQPRFHKIQSPHSISASHFHSHGTGSVRQEENNNLKKDENVSDKQTHKTAAHNNQDNTFNTREPQNLELTNKENGLSSSRQAGKKLLCPKNATPLYGRVPSWWGDSPPENQSSPSKNRRSRQTSEVENVKISKNKETNDEPQKRKQSTAFVVDMGEKDGSTQQVSLSSSLPSFQIKDRLCSYFPTSRKMSLMKRELRRKNSTELSSQSHNGDAASDAGTYVVELDQSDDLVTENGDDDGDWPDFSQEDECANIVSVMSNLDTKDAKESGSQKEADSKCNSSKRTKTCKKVNRKKTFVVFSRKKSHEKEIVESEDKKIVTALPTQDLANKNIESSQLEEPTEENIITKTNLLENECLDTRLLSKESSWNYEALNELDHGYTVKTEILKIGLPTFLKKPTKNHSDNSPNKKMTDSSINFEQFQCSKTSPQSSISGVPSLNERFLSDSIQQTDSDSENVFEDGDQNMLTTRSMKTELLLRPTEEITDHLKKTKRSKPLNCSTEGSHLDKKEDMFHHNKNEIKKTVISSSTFVSPVNETLKSSANSKPLSEDSIRQSSDKYTTSYFSSEEDFSNDKLDRNNLLPQNGGELSSPLSSLAYETEEDDCQPSDLPKSKKLEFRRPESTFSCDAESTLESGRSSFTGLSLGQEIVQRSRNISSSQKPKKTTKPFVPPQKKSADYYSLQKMTSLSSISSNDHIKLPPRYGSANTKRAMESLSKVVARRERRSSFASEQSSTNLSVQGSSLNKNIYNTSSNSKSNVSTGIRLNTTKPKKNCDEVISNLTGVMKYSAQIQLLSGNLLELLSLRKNKYGTSTPKNNTTDGTISSKLEELLSTMKWTSDQIFDLHDSLLEEMEKD